MLISARRLAAKLRGEFATTFSSLRHRDYLVYSIGQLVSMTGTWTQQIALAWITYSITHSAWLLGLVSLFANVPVLLLSLVGGMVADRFDRRRVIMITQYVEMALATLLTVLVFTNHLEVWMILGMSALFGVANAFEMPARQAFFPELVHGENLVNAISLNSVIFNITRMCGPALGAILLVAVGQAACFGLNALSFLAAIVTLHMLRPEITPAPKKKSKVPMSEGLRIAFGTAPIRNIFILTFFTSFFGFQISALLPVFVSDVFHASAGSLGLLSAASALGALGGSLFLASRGKKEQLSRTAGLAAIGVALTLFAFSFSHSIWLSAAINIFIGVAVSMQLNSANSLLQLSVTDDVRGRVMSVYTMTMLGAVPFGSLAIGHLADIMGAPIAVLVCAVACGLSALFYITRKSTAPEIAP